ncbi:MAG TPA: hypothetical protein VM845_05910 [Burkholderiaceae bacterium]|jgi:hypothetical protein|nr:hypothetical protein [Burkholderiaceae bacterium]
MSTRPHDDARTVRSLALTLALSACAAAPGADDTQWPAGVRTQLAALRSDAARRGGGDAALWRVERIEAVTWPDGALGCPQPGRLYTQALIPGHRVQLSAPGRAPLTYHTSERGGWLWCAPSQAQAPLPRAVD